MQNEQKDLLSIPEPTLNRSKSSVTISTIHEHNT